MSFEHEQELVSFEHKNDFNACIEKVILIINSHIGRGHTAEESINSVLREVKYDVLKIYFGKVEG